MGEYRWGVLRDDASPYQGSRRGGARLFSEKRTAGRYLLLTRVVPGFGSPLQYIDLQRALSYLTLLVAARLGSLAGDVVGKGAETAERGLAEGQTHKYHLSAFLPS